MRWSGLQRDASPILETTTTPERVLHISLKQASVSLMETTAGKLGIIEEEKGCDPRTYAQRVTFLRIDLRECCSWTQVQHLEIHT